MKILFVGNSYTFFNDLPTMFMDLLFENGIEVDVESVTKGGRALNENFTKVDETANALREKAVNEYDLLILQEQSILPIIDYDKFLFGVRETVNLISACKVMLYATWGRREGHPVLEEHGWTRLGMTEDLRSAYASAGKEVGALVSNVGLAFAAVLESNPDIELYKSDLTHPSRLGSALAALCHYKTFFGKLPEKCASLDLGEYAEILLSAAGK